MYVNLTWKEGDAGDGRGDGSLQSADGVLGDLLGGDLRDEIANNEGINTRKKRRHDEE